jgi:uncharacterized protein GlcG (DUF336 family)
LYTRKQKLGIDTLLHYVLLSLVCAVLSACGGGSGSGVDGGSTAADCNFTVATTPQNLSAAEVERIVAQAEQAATALGAPATIAVSDRVGNILAVYRMSGAGLTINLRSGRLAVPVQGLDGLNNTIGSELGAIAKAVTGAYLSSSGNAFSTRTASFIIQEHFPPTVNFQPSGPLFGVQFSQLPCGDFVNQNNVVDFGPKRSPLGLAGDPGGFPIYKNGVVVGGIGVMADGEYGIDLTPTSGATGTDERIAQSALKGFETPACIRADRITLGGQIPPYSNADGALVNVSASNVTNLANFIPVAGYYAGGSAFTGLAYGNANSGFTDDATDTLGSGAFIVTNGAANRFPPTAGANGLTPTEVTQIINSAIGVANQARAQIRRPVGSAAQVTVAVTDLDGSILGIARTADAPVFGTDVSVQKARTAAFFSKSNAGANLSALPSVSYADDGLAASGITINFSDYVTASSLAGSTAFTGTNAFSARAIGNIARPLFPDGIDGSPNGSLSKPLAIWSPFSTGLQLDLVYGNLTGSIVTPAPNSNNRCTANPIGINNGIQIFPGAVPIYRGATLVGAIGISGDGVDQDDMIAFLGLARAGNILGTGIANAPNAIRSSQLEPQGVPLRFVNCPQSPFNNSSEQNVCSGI